MEPIGQRAGRPALRAGWNGEGHQIEEPCDTWGLFDLVSFSIPAAGRRPAGGRPLRRSVAPC